MTKPQLHYKTSRKYSELRRLDVITTTGDLIGNLGQYSTKLQEIKSETAREK